MITAAQIQTIRDPGAVLPGIDTMTGNPYATSSLLDVTKITQNSSAPYHYIPSKNEVVVTQAGAVLSGINFGDATVLINANNVTIKNCTFTGTSSFWAVDQPTASGATVEKSTFIGSKSPTENNVWVSSALGKTFENNTFLNSPADAVAIQQGVVTGNYFSGEGYMRRTPTQSTFQIRRGPSPSLTISLMGRRMPVRRARPTATFALRTSSVTQTR